MSTSARLAAVLFWKLKSALALPRKPVLVAMMEFACAIIWATLLLSLILPP